MRRSVLKFGHGLPEKEIADALAAAEAMRNQ
jgi:hypothetical protein